MKGAIRVLLEVVVVVVVPLHAFIATTTVCMTLAVYTKRSNQDLYPANAM